MQSGLFGIFVVIMGRTSVSLIHTILGSDVFRVCSGRMVYQFIVLLAEPLEITWNNTLHSLFHPSTFTFCFPSPFCFHSSFPFPFPSTFPFPTPPPNLPAKSSLDSASPLPPFKPYIYPLLLPLNSPISLAPFSLLLPIPSPFLFPVSLPLPFFPFSFSL